MITKFISLASLFLIFGFTFLPQASDTLIINLHQEFNEDIPIRGYPHEMYLRTLDNYPKYKKEITKTYVGIPANDSISYYYRQSSFIMYDAYKSGDIPKDDFLSFIRRSQIDTLDILKLKFRDNVVFVVGFKDNKQFIIADANRNKNFSDDIKYEFDINFRNNPFEDENYLKNLPTSTFKYDNTYKNKVREYNRKFILYPDRYNAFSFDNGVKQQNYFSIFRFKDFWKGNFTIDKQEIEFYYCGFTNQYGDLYVKPKKIPFNFKDKSSNSQFLHKLNDTIPIGRGYYVVDSINSNISKIYLRKTGNKTNSYGNTTGTYLKNTDFKDFENKPFNTQNIISKKKYTLLDFWGTWCEPCRKLTPKIKKMSKDYSAKLNILSIAIDDNKEAVKEYVSKNEMNWKHGYIPQKEKMKSLAFKDLNIQYYPTFILLDSKGKILYRGSSENFDEILKLIK